MNHIQSRFYSIFPGLMIFRDISYRANEAFINVFIGFIDKKGKVAQVKLVIRVKEKERAEVNYDHFKSNNRMLAENNIGS